MGVKFFLRICFIVSFFIPTNDVQAQDASLSQAYAFPLYLSPSFTGLNFGGRLALNYRDQWPGIENAYRTLSLSYDVFVDEFSSGLGLMYMRDDAGGGKLINQDINVLYAYEFAISKDLYVRPGLNFKYFSRSIGYSNLIMGDEINPSNGRFSGNASNSANVEIFKKFDAAASVMLYHKLFWIGGTVDHLIKSDVGFTDIETNLPMKTTVFGGTKFNYKEGFRGRNIQSLTFAFLFRNQESFNQLDLGTYWYINPLEIGLWYRGLPFMDSEKYTNNDALIFIVGASLGAVKVAYSYDMTLSKLASSSNGTNEFSITYRLNQTFSRKSNRGAIPCPGLSGAYSPGSKKYRSKRRRVF